MRCFEAFELNWLWFASALTCLVNEDVGTSSPSVTLLNGTYTGVSLPSIHQDLFLGMPYARPPIPRLLPPAPLNTSWTGTRKAEKYSPICIGYPQGPANDDVGFELSEDCLSINVIRPIGVKEGSEVPVVVWIYGGGFAMGGSADQHYNGSWIVERSVKMGQPIIFASFNYRVSVFGFLYSEEVESAGLGNFGLLDQLALRWIHENIASFGGDPCKVTIMGESAGAMSVALHLLSPTSSGLFRAAILESGSATSTPYQLASEYQPSYDTIVAETGCTGEKDTLDCLRNVGVEEFVRATNRSEYAWWPVVDGTFLEDVPSRLMRDGKIARVPVLTGQNTDEGATFGRKGLNVTADLAAAVRRDYPHLSNASVDRLLELYPDDPFFGCPYNTGDADLSSGRQDKRSNALYGDLRFHAGRRFLAETLSRLSVPVYSYRFDQPPEGAIIDAGTGHFDEVAYVFSNPLSLEEGGVGNRPADKELAKLMTSMWVSFMNGMDPNIGDDGLEWPRYENKKQSMVFRRHGNYVEDDVFRREPMDFIYKIWAEIQC